MAGMWKDGIGCPSNAWTTPDGVTFNTYTDGACTSGDPKDKRHAGLLLAKTGPTGNNASAGATLQGVKGITLTELGYDHPEARIDLAYLSGSHCGAGAPRFNVTTADDGTLFRGMFVTSAAPDRDRHRLDPAALDGRRSWLSTRRLLPDAYVVKSISIVFDEGQDTAARLLRARRARQHRRQRQAGRPSGPDKPEDKDRDDCKGKDKDNRHFSAPQQRVASGREQLVVCRPDPRRERSDDQRRAQRQLQPARA